VEAEELARRIAEEGLCLPLPQEVRDEVAIRMYLDGVPVNIITQILCISRWTLYRILHRHGVKPARRGNSYKVRRDYDLDEIARIIRNYIPNVNTPASTK